MKKAEQKRIKALQQKYYHLNRNAQCLEADIMNCYASGDHTFEWNGVRCSIFRAARELESLNNDLRALKNKLNID